MPRTISWPYSGCSSMIRRSSGVRGPSLRRTRVGTPSLPTSCRMPANRSASIRRSAMPSSRAISSEARPTRSLCPRVYPSLMSTAWTRARMVARCAACCRWYWAKTQQEMYIGRSTTSADTGPYGLRHSTAIISPARAWTRCGPTEAWSPRQACRGGTRSAVARIPPSRAARTVLKTSAVAQAGSRAYGRPGAARPPGPPRLAGPSRSAYAHEADPMASASWAARHTRRAATGGCSTRPASDPGMETRAAAAGGSRKTAASSSGKKDPAPAGREPPEKGKKRAGSSQARQSAARRASVPQGVSAPGVRAGSAQSPAPVDAPRM